MKNLLVGWLTGLAVNFGMQWYVFLTPRYYHLLTLPLSQEHQMNEKIHSSVDYSVYPWPSPDKDLLKGPPVCLLRRIVCQCISVRAMR